MAPSPIIFALANPDPEVTYEAAKAARPDSIVATGRSDYPNQVNNVLGFPFIFRGALDVRASAINEEMKMAAARALAALAREPVPEEVSMAYGGTHFEFGPDYIIPKPFDVRLLREVSTAVARAACKSGVAREPIEVLGRLRRAPRRDDQQDRTPHAAYVLVARGRCPIVFAEGETPRVINACRIVLQEGTGRPLLLGREAVISQLARRAGIPEGEYQSIDPHDSAVSEDLANELTRTVFREGIPGAEGQEAHPDAVLLRDDDASARDGGRDDRRRGRCLQRHAAHGDAADRTRPRRSAGLWCFMCCSSKARSL